MAGNAGRLNGRLVAVPSVQTSEPRRSHNPHSAGRPVIQHICDGAIAVFIRKMTGNAAFISGAAET